MNGDGISDYVVVAASGDLKVWYTEGVAENFAWDGPHTTSVVNNAFPPEAIRLADINGDGFADILGVDTDGKITAFLSTGKPFPNFHGAQVIFDGTKSTTRNDLQFADITNDGLADLLTVDAASGAVTVQINSGPASNGGWNWQPATNFSPGRGAPGSLVVITDITGDGLGDYLVVDKSTSVTGWLNQC